MLLNEVQTKLSAAGIVLLCALALFLPTTAFAITSEELFAEADGIMQQIDILQTSINEEHERYDAALRDHDQALEAAREAQKQVEAEQARMEQYQEQLSAMVTNMYKTGGSSSFLEVVLGAESFDEFLTKWDAYAAVTGLGADLVVEAKECKAAYEAAKADHEDQMKIASHKMEEAESARLEIESKQETLREEAEKITEQAIELQAQEELEREAARQAAAAAEAAMKAQEEAIKNKGGETGSLVLSGSGLLNNPCPDGSPTSPFGWRDFNGGSFHRGYDIGAPEGTPYYAAAYGTVIYETHEGGYNGGAGNWIVIAHGNGLVTKYMHSSKVFVSVGDEVNRGQKIGEVGNTGESFGAHLHFQVEYNGVAVDPAPLI